MVWGGVRGADDKGRGHPLNRRREREMEERNQKGKRSKTRVCWVRVCKGERVERNQRERRSETRETWTLVRE